jgi:glutathione S-transferase
MTVPHTEPVLWHLKISNFNEKARWALDYKQVAHVRRAAMPGAHRKIAAKLTGGRTFPILIVDGRAIGDSTAIIAELERRYPGRPLYPSDPAERRRALELEDFFDEQLGPCARRLVIAHLLPHTGLFLSTFVPDLPRWRRPIARAVLPMTRSRIRADQGITETSLDEAVAKIRLVGERFRQELSAGGYLIGDSFSVADLTLAALVAPAVCPHQFPYPQPQRDHPALAPLQQILSEAGISFWVREMYRRHRGVQRT